MIALRLAEIAEAGSSTSSKWAELGGEILGFGREIAKIRTESRPILGVADCAYRARSVRGRDPRSTKVRHISVGGVLQCETYFLILGP